MSMSRKQRRALVVAIIEDVIVFVLGTAGVAAVILIATLLLKRWGCL